MVVISFFIGPSLISHSDPDLGGRRRLYAAGNQSGVNSVTDAL